MKGIGLQVLSKSSQTPCPSQFKTGKVTAVHTAGRSHRPLERCRCVMLPRDEQTLYLLSRHRSSAGGAVWSVQCSRLEQAALGKHRAADPCAGAAGVTRAAVCATLSPWEASAPREQFMPDQSSNLGCGCCSSSWVPVGNCAFGHAGYPSSAPEGSWKAHSWWMLWPFFGVVH